MVIAAQVLAQQFILVILEFTRTLILVLDFQILDIQQYLMAMELLTAMVMELTLLRPRQEQHME
jgi:hypothetical protein